LYPAAVRPILGTNSALLEGTEMSITIQEELLDKGLRKISLQGILDAPGAMAIEEQFRARLLEKGGKVIVDMKGVEYMSSYGLRMLLVGAKALRDQKGELHLAAPNPHVMKVITLAGYDTMFPVHETIEDALLYAGKGHPDLDG